MPNGYFGQNFQKRPKTEKEHHHQILHIRNSLGTTFQLKLTILIFGPNLLKKGISGLKQKNRRFACSHGRYLLY